MAFTHIQSGSAVNGSPTLTITAGNTVVVLVSWYQNTHTVTALSGNSNTWVHPASALAANGDWNTDVFYVLAANSGSTSVTPTWTGGTPAGFGIHMYELHPAGTPSFDKISIATGNTVTSTTSSLTTASANEAILSMINSSGSAATVPTGGWATKIHTASAYYEDTSYLIDAGVAGSKSINWDLVTTASYAQTNIALIDTVSGGTTRGAPMGSGGTAFNGGRTFQGIID